MPNPLLERITPIFREIFNQPDLVLSPSTNASCVEGWDSYAHINLIVALEEHFGVGFSTRELGEMTCVGDLLRLLEIKGAKP